MNQNSASAVSSPLFTEEQAALYLTRSVSSLRRDRKRGTGPGFVKIGRSVRYLRSELDRFIFARATISGGSGVDHGR
jgi:predicted DNA-binding transcriptional regulator AlpA